MKLGLHTFAMGAGFSLEEIAELWASAGFHGVEFRCDMQQEHGVDPAMTPQERAHVRTVVAGAGLQICGLGTGQRFEYLDPAQRLAAVERSKQFIDLAADLGAPRIRVYGNQFPAGADKAEVAKYVTESVAECAAYAEGTSVDVMFHMHGDFNSTAYCLPLVQSVNSPNLALDYNSDARDIVNGSIAATFYQVKDYVRHVHVHGIEEGKYPYRELFRILKDINYGGYITVARGYEGGGERKVIEMYGALLREMVWNA
jgi:sugar phosphate isomerase/epimerase